MPCLTRKGFGCLWSFNLPLYIGISANECQEASVNTQDSLFVRKNREMSEFELVQPSDHELNRPETQEKVERLHFENFIRLGGSNIDVHLEDDDFDTAFKLAVRKYRQLGSGSVYQSYGALELLPQQQQYILDSRVDTVIKVWRARGLFGGASGGSGAFESFGAATANTLLRGGIGQNGAAFDLYSYDQVLSYQETLDRLFVRELHYVFRHETNSIFFTQVPIQREHVILHVAVLKSVEEMLNDHWCYQWLQDYSLAELKSMLGEKYRIFSTLPGAQGGTVMKGEAIAGESREEKQKLEEDLLLYADNGFIPQPIRG